MKVKPGHNQDDVVDQDIIKRYFRSPEPKHISIFKAGLTLSILFYLLLTFSGGAAEAGASGSKNTTGALWAGTLFNGIYTDRTFGKTTFNIPGHFENNYLHALSLSRKIWESDLHFSAELEGMFAKHHGKHQSGYQHYEEYTLAFLLRYHTFPWDDYLDASFAIGEGLSLTSKTPKREVQRDNGKSQRLLNYLSVELTFTLPRYPKTSLIYRIHHRSGVFGLFGGVKGASDFYLLGLRYRF